MDRWRRFIKPLSLLPHYDHSPQQGARVHKGINLLNCCLCRRSIAKACASSITSMTYALRSRLYLKAIRYAFDELQIVKTA